MRKLLWQPIAVAITLSVPGVVRADDSLEVATQNCKAGNLTDCNRLGTYYMTKRLQEPGANGFARSEAIAKDLKEAERFYTMACDGRDALGCYQLGFLYETGEGYGVTGGAARAIPLYRKACDGGSADGCSSLAGEYESGIVVAKNAAMAAAYFKKAALIYQVGCNLGDYSQCDRRGYHLDRAADLYRKACQGGDNSSCEALRSLHSPVNHF